MNNIKEKFILGLTKRQAVCFGIGLAVGIPVFFLSRRFLGLEGAIFAMGACAAPAILCGIYRKNGVYFEKQLRYMWEFFTRPRKRYYRTVNIFQCIENQLEYSALKRKERDSGGR